MKTNGNGARHFEDKPATRERTPVMIGLMGPSGGGKTFSALRLATGIQRVSGGEIYVIDTEARRSLHYADKFKFRHVEFSAPFSPLDYMAAIKHCVDKGAGVVVVDSMSHEHEGPGGVLEMHDAEMERLSGGDARKAERVKMLAWAKPKAERRRLINTVLQMPVNVIFCFRAKEKIKMASGGAPVAQGWMPIAGEEYLYEMTACALLPPGANGVPEWSPQEPGSRQMVKLPEQFRATLTPGHVLDEATGEAMARWSAGGAAPTTKTTGPVVHGTNGVGPVRPVDAGEVFRFPGGPFVGKTMADPDVPISYLETVRDKASNSQRSRDMAKAEIDRRARHEAGEVDDPPLPDDDTQHTGG